ncbi:phiSA1p31-related protein [Streptomyces decoyicus]
MTADFKAGEKAHHESYGEVEVSFGPAAFAAHPCMYVVKRSDTGDHVLVVSSSLSRPLKFKEGQKVCIFGSTLGEIESGPYQHRSGDCWLVKDAEGFYSFAPENYTKPVQEFSRATTEYAGVFYEFGAEYEDRDGDRWVFYSNNARAYARTPEALESRLDESLARVVENYGPLKRVQQP